jgi:hypothetical protein
MNLSHLTDAQFQELRKNNPAAARLEELRKKATLTDAESAEKPRLESFCAALKQEGSIREPLKSLPVHLESLEIEWMPESVPRRA